MPRDKQFDERVQRIEQLVREIEQVPDPALRSAAKALIQSVMDLHGAAIERILELIHQSGETGQAIIDQLGREQPVRGLLLLYGLHPLDLETRVREALAKLRPQLAALGGEAVLVSVSEGTVRVRLSSAGCSSTSTALARVLEDGLREAAPEAALALMEGQTASGLVQLELPRKAGQVPASEVSLQP